jgi:undecaprenyl-diphosphatase
MVKILRRAGRFLPSAETLRHIEWLPLAELLLVGVAVWVFAEVTDEVAEGDLQAFDRSVMMAFRHGDDAGDPLGPRWFEELMRDVTALGSAGVLGILTLAASGYLWLQGKRSAVLYVLVAVLGAQGISSTLKVVFGRPRPDLFPHGVQVYTASFPSGHSVMSAATFLTLGVMLARYQKLKRLRVYLVLLAIFLAVAVGISRVYLGVHWPTDVVAGWAVGAAWALGCWGVAALLQRRGILERKPVE